MILKITQDYKFRNRYFRFSIKKENVLMTRLILSKSFLPEGTNALAKQQTLFTLHAPPMQGQMHILGEMQKAQKSNLKTKFETIQEFHFIQIFKTTH